MFGKRTHARILMHRRAAATYVDGRYLHVDAKLSVRSKRDREIARELATSIVNEVGATEAAFDLMMLNIERMNKGEAVEKQEGAVIPMNRD